MSHNVLYCEDCTVKNNCDLDTYDCEKSGFKQKKPKVKRKWINGCVYPVKPIGKYPQIYAERAMHGKYRGISLNFFEVKGQQGYTISMTTRIARLLIKRIKLALEDK